MSPRHHRINLANGTWIDGEMVCTDIGQFRRKALARRQGTSLFAVCMAALPDTAFSIPATTASFHGYLKVADDGTLEFVPHTDQTTQTPAQFRADYKKGCQ